MKRIFRAGGALALLTGLLAPGVSLAQPNQLYDGVVVDAARGTAYVMSPQGGIDALELASGNVMWKSRDAAKPLAVANGALVAQGNPGPKGELVLVTLDAQRGAARNRVGVELPAGLRSRLVDSPSRSFRTRAVADGQGNVVVTWAAEDAQGMQAMLPAAPEGAPVVDTQLATAPAPLRGAVRLDLTEGRAVAVPYEGAQELQSRVQSSRSAGAAADPRQLVSLDGRHTLRSERVTGASPWSRYRWTITDASGAVVGNLEAPVSMAPFVVSGTKVLYVALPGARKEASKVIQEPLRLRALDLQTGIEQWAAPVVDTTFRGPFPP